MTLRPEDLEIRSSLSRLLIERGRYEEGLAIAEATLARDPEFVKAAYNRALALQALGRRDEALLGYERVMAMAAAPEEAKRDVAGKIREFSRSPASKEPTGQSCANGLVGC